MNSGPTSERAYGVLKQLILAGAFRPGEQLEPGALAKQLEISQTPVRDALHILTGEGLVVTGANEGFHLPQLSAPDLQDLYGWNAQVLVLAIGSWGVGTDPSPSAHAQPTATATPTDAAAASADATAELFETIARRSTNIEHSRTIATINARLHPIRRAESLVFTATGGEFALLAAATSADNPAQLTRLLRTYHRLRQRAAADVLRALYRAN